MFNCCSQNINLIFLILHDFIKKYDNELDKKYLLSIPFEYNKFNYKGNSKRDILLFPVGA